MASNIINMKWGDKNFEEKLSPNLDAIYKKHFKVYDIIRSDRKNYLTNTISKILDEKLGIDTIIYLNDGGFITAQEKILRNSKSTFDELTIEYKNNRVGALYGDWYHLAAQIYLFVYASEHENEIFKYWLLDVLKLRMFLQRINNLESFIRYNKKPNRSNFLAIPFNIIPNNEGIIIFNQ